MKRALRIPAMLSAIVLEACGSHGTVVADASKEDAPYCAVDGPVVDANGCLEPCGDVTGGTGLCHGMEVCVDPCFHCPPGCEPLV
jgi:hypothetical protein